MIFRNEVRPESETNVGIKKDEEENADEIEFHTDDIPKTTLVNEDSSNEDDDSLLNDYYESDLGTYREIHNLQRRSRTIKLVCLFSTIIAVVAVGVLISITTTYEDQDEDNVTGYQKNIDDDNAFLATHSKNSDFSKHGTVEVQEEIKNIRCEEIRKKHTIDQSDKINMYDCASRNVQNIKKMMFCQTECVSKRFCNFSNGEVKHETGTKQLCDAFLQNFPTLNTDSEFEMISETCSLKNLKTNKGFGACEKICSRRACCFMTGEFECNSIASEWCDEFKDCEKLLYVKPNDT